MKLNKIIINLAIIAILIFASSKIFSRFVELNKAEQTINNLKSYNKSEELKSINEDYRFWLTIGGTQIDYPVVQAEDNDFYLNKDFNKEESVSGMPFLDFRNNCLNDKNTIIYAHNMKNGSMFGELDKFKDENFFNENNQITIEVNNEINTYEVFSAYVEKGTIDYLKVEFSEDEYEEYINNAIEKSMHQSNVEVDVDDKIITLSTCSYEFENARFVVHAKLIK